MKIMIYGSNGRHISFFDRVTAPVQLIAGRLDQRCPVSDSIEAHEVLQSMGKEAGIGGLRR